MLEPAKDAVAIASLATEPLNAERLNGSVIQSKADLHGYLPVGNLVILEVAANFGDLKPLHISDRLTGSRDRVGDCVFYAIWRRSDQLDLLVDVITHNPIKPLPLAPGEQIPGLKFFRLDRLRRRVTI